MIIGKGIAFVKPFDLTLPLRPVEIEFKNNRCCLEVFNTSDCTIEFQYSQEKKIVYMGLEFQVYDDKVCYTPFKDKCEAIRNLDSPKTLKQMRAFCGMVNFLSSFLPNLRRLLIPIYDIQKKLKKKLLVNPPVLKAPTPDGLFRLESNTSREGVGSTLLQKHEWVVIIQKDYLNPLRILALLN